MAVLGRLRLPLAQKALLSVVARYCARRNKVCYARFHTLGAEISSGPECEKTARRASTQLERLGLLRVHRRPGRTSEIVLVWGQILKMVVEAGQNGRGQNDRTVRSWRPTGADAVTAKGLTIGEALRNESSSELAPQVVPGARPAEDDSLHLLFRQLQTRFPGLTRNRFQWAVERVRSRAKTPPRNAVLFFSKALPSVFENMASEVESFLTEQALRMRAEGNTVGDIKELLKQTAADHDLQYSADSVSAVLDNAEARLQRQRNVQIELHAGERRNR
jgi:hypothetical protein